MTGPAHAGHRGHRYQGYRDGAVRGRLGPGAGVCAAGGGVGGLADRKPVADQGGLLGQRESGLAASGVTQAREYDPVAGQARQEPAGLQLGRDYAGDGIPADLPQVEPAGGGQPGANDYQRGRRRRGLNRGGQGGQQVE
jgi:hypothetical protein